MEENKLVPRPRQNAEEALEHEGISRASIYRSAGNDTDSEKDWIKVGDFQTKVLLKTTKILIILFGVLRKLAVTLSAV